jgi:hypothetical protein
MHRVSAGMFMIESCESRFVTVGTAAHVCGLLLHARRRQTALLSAHASLQFARQMILNYFFVLSSASARYPPPAPNFHSAV